MAAAFPTSPTSDCQVLLAANRHVVGRHPLIRSVQASRATEHQQSAVCDHKRGASKPSAHTNAGADSLVPGTQHGSEKFHPHLLHGSKHLSTLASVISRGKVEVWKKKKDFRMRLFLPLGVPEQLGPAPRQA